MFWNSTIASYVSSSSSDLTALLRPDGFGPGRALMATEKEKPTPKGRQKPARPDRKRGHRRRS